MIIMDNARALIADIAPVPIILGALLAVMAWAVVFSTGSKR